MIFQFFNLVDDLTVAGNVLLPAQLAGSGAARPGPRAAELLAELGIAQHRDAYPGRLSGGERQRVAIARALVNNPALLLADEPTGAVDTAAGRAIGQLLLDLNTAGQTLLIVTHNPELAGRYASRVIQLADGRVTSDAERRRPARQRRRARAMTAAPVLRAASGRGSPPPGAAAGGVRGAGASHRGGGARPDAAHQRQRADIPPVAATHGADLAVTINAAKVSAAQLAATRHLPGVTQDAGPYPETTITARAGPAGLRRPVPAGADRGRPGVPVRRRSTT